MTEVLFARLDELTLVNGPNIVALNNLDATPGLLTQTGAAVFTKRTLLGTASQITVTNGDGVAGNPTLSFPNGVTGSGAVALATAPTIASPNISSPIISAGITMPTQAIPASPAVNNLVVVADSGQNNLTVKNSSGSTFITVAPSAAVSHQFVTSLAANGVLTTAQPAFSDISGVITVGQMPTGTRTILTADTTIWVRSDGNDANTGLTNSAGGAKLTWNNLYSTLASSYDTGGHTITLKSGTANTYAGGLFMNVAWVGGGNLIVDLNGSNIAETTTKGIINNVTQSGLVTIQNSAGLGVGGEISSLNFAAVQNSGASQLGIGVGITTNTSGDAAYEATQSGGISFTNPINVKGTGGRYLMVSAYNGGIALNGQAVNFLSDQTYSIATIGSYYSGEVILNSASFNLNGHTISGPRYYVTGNATIYTGGAGANFIPGSTAGTGDSGGSYDTTTYGSLPTQTGTLQAAQFPALTGDVTTSAGSLATTLANIPSGVVMAGTILSTNIAQPAAPAAGKTLIWTDSTYHNLKSIDSSGQIGTTVAPQAASGNLFVTGLNVSGGLITAQPAFSNLSGSVAASQMPALMGEATTSAGAVAVTLTNSAVIGKVLTGYTSGAGTVAATDTILQAIQKLNGNDATNANLTGDVTSVGNATTLTNAPVIAKVLTGLSASAGTLAATDSILQAFNKLAGLIDNAAWTTYTPTVTSGSGTPTTVTATGRYKQIGKTMLVQASATVTSTGSAGGAMIITVPTASNNLANYAGSCFESGVSGKSGAGVVQVGFQTKIYTTDATGASWWGTNGKIVDCTVVYEVA